MPTSSAHRARQIAESFGVDADRYDRARPPYPRELIDRVVAGAPGRVFLNVGCGTGIEARQFQAAGCRVLGVEPDPRMADFARRGGVEVEVSTFEDWNPAGRVFDAVVAGQSWHWVDPVAGPATAARVLRPGGLLAVFAHVFAPPPPVADAFAEAYRRLVPGSPFPAQPSGNVVDFHRAGFARFAEHIAAGHGFGEPEQWRFDWARPYTREEWLDLLATTGGLTGLAPAVRAEILDAVGTAVDALGGGFTMDYTTLAVVAVRTGQDVAPAGFESSPR
ncbi:class I SAM-dependent methyltransferase [Amycolatopsis granulosa]|uniref:class I SAM-dependent methyltransferase n=1 Tax=Amycolatopsis granulosa TaxID=185684 RepID=UPI001424732F|nr:class I SAM-dependent methyltransferase [Amycolatopsis granulosa]NIH84179.1 SAM-dependent methyltransferase [Amycolatopsis granulosa]